MLLYNNAPSHKVFFVLETQNLNEKNFLQEHSLNGSRYGHNTEQNVEIRAEKVFRNDHIYYGHCILRRSLF